MSAASPAVDLFAAAVDRLRAAGLVAFPTETVWGLGADASSEAAVARLRAWKGRDRPIALLVAGPEVLPTLGFELSRTTHSLIAAFWPGPLTLILPCRRRFAAGIAREDGAVGVRCSPHPIAAGLARRTASEGIGPVTATSLNRQAEPPARSHQEALAVVGEALDAPLVVNAPGLDAGGTAPSTVVDLTGSEPQVLRYAALPRERIDPWLTEGGGR